MALTKVTNRMIADAAINVKDYGALGDGTNDDTTSIQSAITAASSARKALYIPAGKYKVTSTLTVPEDGYLQMNGSSGAFNKGAVDDYSDFSTLSFEPSGADTALLDFGNNCLYGFDGICFLSDSETSAYTAISIGILGDDTSQTASDSIFLISRCSFHDWGATAISFGGENYGTVQLSHFHNCTQCFAVNGLGEISFNDNHFQDQPNSVTFTPPANNGDAWNYIKTTVTRWNDNIFALTDDLRPWFLFDECTDVSFSGNKMEHPGRTALTYDQIQIKNASVSGRVFSFTQNAMTASSATGDFSGRFLSTKGSVAISNLVFSENSATYGTGVSTNVPIVDVSTNKPKVISINGLYRVSADNAVIKFSDGADAGGSATYGTLAGLQSDAIGYVTRQFIPFTISASQTDTQIPLGDVNRAFYFENSLVQVLPVSMTVHSSGSPADTVSFKLDWDTGGLDKVELGSSDTNNQVWFPIRSDYIKSPDQVSAQTLLLRYTSGASASTSINYYITLIYALIEERSTARFNKFFVDAS